jgi:hypothetical protein
MSAQVGPREQFKILRNLAASVYRCPIAPGGDGPNVALTVPFKLLAPAGAFSRVQACLVRGSAEMHGRAAASPLPLPKPRLKW